MPIIPAAPRCAGFDQGSRQVQDALMEQAQEEHVAGCIVLALQVGAAAAAATATALPPSSAVL